MDDLRDQIKAWTDAAASREATAAVRADDIIGHAPLGQRPRRRLHTSTRVLIAAVALVVVATAVVVAAHADRQAVHVGADTRGPGSPIIGGIKVLPGSKLIGLPFPDVFDQSDGTNWQALISVTGDPVATFEAYVYQIQSLGFGLSSYNCRPSLSGSGASPFNRMLACDAGLTPNAKSGWRYTGAGLELVSPGSGDRSFATTISLSIGIGDPRTPSTTMSDLGRYFASFPTTTIAPPTTDPSDVRFQASLGPSRLPTIGEPIAPAWMDPGLHLRVVAGSTLLAPAAPLDGGSMGWLTVARLTGDPGKIMDIYLHQGRHDIIYKQEVVVDGHRILSGWWSVAGGPKLNLIARQDASGTWLLRINVQND